MSEQFTQEKIAELRALYGPASAWPWICEWNWESEDSEHYAAWGESPTVKGNSLKCVADVAQADMLLIQTAVNLFPDALNEISALQSQLDAAQEENKRLVEAHKEVCRRYHTKQKNAKKWQLAADLAYMCDVSQSALNGGK